MRVMLYGDIKDVTPDKVEDAESVKYTVKFPNHDTFHRDAAVGFNSHDWDYREKIPRNELKNKCIQLTKMYRNYPHDFMESGY